MSGSYACLWEYEVPEDHVPEFLALHGPAGEWVRLFRRAPGYLDTTLYRDRERPERFVTLDRWASEARYRSFREAFASEYGLLDATGERLTRREAPLGSFAAVDAL